MLNQLTIKSFVLGVIFGAVLVGALESTASNEPLPNFEEKSLPVLNDQLRQIQNTIANHEKRLIAGGL